MPVVLYGYETWSLTLREERRLRVFENKVLRRIFGLKRDEVTGEWRRLHKEELYALYSSPNIIRVIKSRTLRWAGLGNLREGNHLEDPGIDGRIILNGCYKSVIEGALDWSDLAQDRDRWCAFVNAVMNLLVP